MKLQTTQSRVGDCINIYQHITGYGPVLVAHLFDGQNHFVVDDQYGTIGLLKLAGKIPKDFRVELPITVAQARLIDAMPTLDINL